MEGSKKIKGLFSFNAQLSMLSQSYKDCGRDIWRTNICPDCRKLQNLCSLDDHLSDLGLCGGCQAIGRVYDVTLLSVYTALNFRVDEVSSQLPILRQPFPHRIIIPFDTVIKRIEHVFEAKSKQPLLPEEKQC